jgi:hypothetical protein
VDVGQNTTLGDGNVSEKLVQLLVIADGELKMTGDDTGLLVVTSGVASQFEDFSCEVLKDSCEVDGSTWNGSATVGSSGGSCRMTHQHQHAGRSCPCGEDGGHDRLGMRDQPWRNAFQMG